MLLGQGVDPPALFQDTLLRPLASCSPCYCTKFDACPSNMGHGFGIVPAHHGYGLETFVLQLALDDLLKALKGPFSLDGPRKRLCARASAAEAEVLRTIGPVILR